MDNVRINTKVVKPNKAKRIVIQRIRSLHDKRIAGNDSLSEKIGPNYSN